MNLTLFLSSSLSCLKLLLQAGKLANRLFYLSIPPNIFVDVVRCASITASSTSGWTRVIVEKPFGRDSESSGELTRCLKQYLNEDQIFRYLLSMRLLFLSIFERELGCNQKLELVII